MLFHFKMYIYLLTAVGTKRKKEKKGKSCQEKNIQVQIPKKGS